MSNKTVKSLDHYLLEELLCLKMSRRRYCNQFLDDSKAKIFHENLPNYYKNAKSAGYGKNTKKTKPLYVRKPQVVLPPLQNTKYRSQQLSSDEICHQDFVQYEESFAVKRTTIKGIVKPNLIRKDLMKLRDPTARPRGSKQTAVVEQEVIVKSSIKCEQELKLPMIPQPPPCLLYTSPSPRDKRQSRMPSSA